MLYIEKHLRYLMTTVFGVNMSCSLVGSDSSVGENELM